MNCDNPALQQFLETWLAEFIRAIETSTGRQRSLSFSTVETVSIPKTASAMWLKQVFSGERDFQVWIGAQEATWKEIGKSSEDAASDDLRSTYLDIVNQAQQGAATVTSLGLRSPIRCGMSETLSTAQFDPASFFICDLELTDGDRPPIVIAVEQAALSVLGSDSNKVETAALRRMADLSLPVSVSLGSTKLEITKILRARAGSVISLAKDVSDSMELLVDGVIVARGELVVVKGNYGFRVQQIVNRSQRISLCSD